MFESAKTPLLPRPKTIKECLTKSDPAQLAAGPDKDDDDNCKLVKPASVAGKTWSADKACPAGAKSHAEFTADSPDRIHGLVIRTGGKGGSAVTISIGGRWLGASCAGIQ